MNEVKPKNLLIIENWLAQKNGEEPKGAFEFILYSDAYIVGQIEDECGPYLFLNTVPGFNRRTGAVLPYIVVRCFYVEGDEPKYQKIPKKTDASMYHGGNSFMDEIAALSSLLLGARIKASSVTRIFEDLKNNPMGSPINWYYQLEPNINFDSRGIKIPAVTGQKNLELLHKLNLILNFNCKEAVAFMRSARLYQEALWIGETDPNSAWLMLVASLESVAGCWRENTFSNEEILKQANPVLINFLLENDASSLTQGIADILSNLTGSTKKFLNFCLQFLPEAPETRPLEYMQIEWTEDTWKNILKIIYEYRSKALHEGTPFPSPMSDPPHDQKESGALSERGTVALAVSQGNVSWEAKDLPINLNLFTMVTQQILLNWLSYIEKQQAEKA